MVTNVRALHVALLALTTAVTATLAGYAWRRSEPGTDAFVGLLAAFTVYSGAQLVGLLTPDPGLRVVWENVQWTGTAFIPVFWTLFAFEYTGYDELITRRTVAALSVIPVLTIAFAWTNPAHGLLWAENTPVTVDGLVLVSETFGPWFWVFVAYTYVLITVGSALLLDLIRVSDYLYADQSALLVVGVTVPVVANALTLAGITPIHHPALDMTPYAFTVTGLAFGYALFRHRLFDLVPATRQLGRHGAVAQLEDGVVILDADRRVIHLNPAAADQFDTDAASAFGRPITDFVDESALEFDTADALAELERDGATYEIRTSPIRDRTGDRIGHTLVSHDVTERKRRERRRARERRELETLNELNAVLRGVNAALIDAATRRDIEDAVTDRLAASSLYDAACIADAPTVRGDADRWTVAGDTDRTPPSSAPTSAPASVPGSTPATTPARPDGHGDSAWSFVPLTYGRTVYGALGTTTDRTDVDDRERDVLAELGRLVAHAIDAVETRHLLAAAAVTELELENDDDALARATRDLPGTVHLAGFVPDTTAAPLAYLATDGVPATQLADALAAETDGTARTVDAADTTHVEWTATDTLLAALSEHGAHVRDLTATDGATTYTAEVASDKDVRVLIDRLRHTHPTTTLRAKRHHTRATEHAHGIPEDTIADLTDRQRDALEAAYRAGYFHWPRDSTAEDVAKTLDITAPTLHAHLRKAEGRLLDALFGDERGR